MQRVIVTAGGMRQSIDDVRTLVNSSSGALAQIIAQQLLRRHVQVDWVHGPDCPVVDHPALTAHMVHDPTELLDTMTTLLTTGAPVDAVVHAMAVADYQPAGSYTRATIETLLQDNNSEPITSSKISSDHDELFLRLTRAPKIIDHIKALSPRTFLVGFKLLSEATDEELFDAGFALLRRTRASLIVANDLAQIRSGTGHRGLIVFPEKHADIVTGDKPALASRIVSTMWRRYHTEYPRSIQSTADVAPESRSALPQLRACGSALAAGLLPVVDGGTYGNMSVRTAPSVLGSAAFVITGRGVDKRALRADTLAFIESTRPSAAANAYMDVFYRGPVKPSIDSAIHASVYAASTVNALLHVHDPALYEGLPLNDNNHTCGSRNERDSIIEILPTAPSWIVQLHKHGVLIGGSDLDACAAQLATLSQRLAIAPIATNADHAMVVEWREHAAEVSVGKAPYPFDERHLRAVRYQGRSIGVVFYHPTWVKHDNPIVNTDSESYWSGEFFLYLSPQAAPAGERLGERLIRMVEQIARRDNCLQLQLLTRTDCNVVGYYQARGFTEIAYTNDMHRLVRSL